MPLRSRTLAFVLLFLLALASAAWAFFGSPARAPSAAPAERPAAAPAASQPEAAAAVVSVAPAATPADAAASAAAVPPATPARSQLFYRVRQGDTLGAIALRFDVTSQEIAAANNLASPDSLSIGQRLLIPGATAQAGAAEPAPAGRALLPARLPERARNAPPDSPLYRATWVTYYGRPDVPIMGILGEYDLDELVPLLRAQARAYDDANGPELTVLPAIHLIYGMATAKPGTSGDHLTYLEDDVVRRYIERAAWEGMGVILDVQIGAVTPLESIRPAFPYLKYRNVQLALDPEFAMTNAGQTIPGQPPGTISGEQINQVQTEMVHYMQEQNLPYHKMLVVHQFLPTMIIHENVVEELPSIDVVVCADGFGPPWPKISKYNAFMAENSQFAGFKLFYRWDDPLMSEGQAMGAEPYPNIGSMEITPSLIVYQ